MEHDAGEALLLALLNSTPVVAGEQLDELADAERAPERLRAWGGRGTLAELAAVRAVRGDLQAVVRGRRPAQALGRHLAGLVQVPTTDGGHLAWHLQTGQDHLLAARAVLAYFALAEQAPGRVRPCQNVACHLFLLDRSRAGTARWCSMTTCGNRMKARRHADRTRTAR